MADNQLLFVSPHFDDVVLSCSSYLISNPGSVVATVCSGVPAANAPAGQWDRFSGFSSGVEAVVVRQNEDRSALRLLGAQQAMLGFFDRMYLGSGQFHEQDGLYDQNRHDHLSAIEESVGSTLDTLAPTHCFFPLGIFSEDHLLTRRACLLALARRPWCKAMIYLDLPHAMQQPSVIQAQLNWLHASRTNEISQVNDMYAKHRAVNCYRSQTTALRLTFPQYWPKMFHPDAEVIYSMATDRVRECADKIERATLHPSVLAL